MKILGVRFKNLNSLAGEWQIDFSHPAYASDGIFAITGPTGAGKTTILDAVCLGLYGRTPRLDRVTKSGNEIMSRQTGECFAEVTFETQKGRYRCHWGQHRAGRKADGELQQARHEVADADSGKVLESKILQVGAFIEKATGMDFERFTRSMLLAQGGFTAFLQARPDERAPILEQITGTGIYSRISMKVHERRAEERDKIDLLQAELKGIRVLGDEAVRELQEGLQERQSREGELEMRLGGLRKAALWLETVAALKKEIDELNKQWEAFAKREEAFAQESEKLEKGRRALVLEGDDRGVAALRTQQDRETEELRGAIAALPEKNRACAEALAGKEAAEARLQEARIRQQTEGDVIKKVRDLDARLGEQKRQAEERDRSIAEVEKQGRAYKDDMENLAGTLKKSQTELEAVHDYQTRHAPDAMLLTTLTAIERSFEALRGLEADHVKASSAFSEAAGRQTSATAACKKLETDHERARQEYEKGQVDVQRLAEEIDALLKGREISQWRREADALKEREGLLIQAGEAMERIDKASSALDRLKEGLEACKARHEKLAEEIKACSERKTLLEKEAIALETQVSLLYRIRSLEEERKRLEDDTPCPLCGAVHHPYAQGNIPALDGPEALLKKAKIAFKKVSEALRKLENELAKTTAEIGHGEKEMAEKQAAGEADTKKCAEVLSRLDIETAPEGFSGKVGAEMAGVRALIAETAVIVAAAEEKGKREKAAQKALERQRDQFTHTGSALLESRHKVETARLDHDRLIGDVRALVEKEENARAAALKDVEPYGIKELPSTNRDAVLMDLTGRKEAWQAMQAEETAQEKRIRDLKAGMAQEQALLASLEKDLAARIKDRDEILTQCATLSNARRELFGDKEADQEEKRLADAAEGAGKALEEAREAHGQREKEFGALQEKIALLKENIGRRAVELAQAEQKLIERIRGAGFADEADYRSSCLNEEERERLTGREKALLKEKTELNACRKGRSETLAAEEEKGLTDQPLEKIRDDIGACDADLKQMRLDIGGIANSLKENEKLKESQRERIGQIDAQRRECTRWDDLHQLIGSADGKKFRNFAQGLTFEMMAAQANRQLRKMTDRYLLIRDASQPLELNVIDNYQAGEIRSTKNLSGGESFIVSLALALGLSQMASRNVRVDSLFLDEGFGTLDEDALETALETLAGLRQDGKLIGVISHVTALKERIATQIQVIPETGGRSSLTGPGCLRVKGPLQNH